jgi:hypothetical protein
MQLGRLGALVGFSIGAIGAGINYVDPANKAAGLILIAIGAATILVSVPRWAYVNRTQIRARLTKMEQSHFLLVALVAGIVMVAALGGAWWKSTQASLRIGSSVSNPPSSLAGPAPTSLPTTSAVKALRPIPDSLRDDYFKLLGHLSGILNKKVRPTYEDVALIANQASHPAIGLYNYPEARDKLQRAVSVLTDTYDDIYRHAIPEANELFAERLKYIMDVGATPDSSPIYVLSQKTSMFASHINQAMELAAKSGDKIKEHEFTGLFQAEGELLSSVVEKTKNWARQCNERIRQE